jgi:23S rRNA pseudouridine955/2504/2580 synthase
MAVESLLIYLSPIRSDTEADRLGSGYLALVHGRWERGSREVTAPLRKRVLRSGERMVEVSERGKDAVTRLRPVTLFTLASLLEIAIDTGRTHQIRVHTSLVGHPVAGDTKYGDAAFNATMARMGLRRMFLHSHSLDFSLGTRDISVSAPLDDDLKSVLERLGHSG